MASVEINAIYGNYNLLRAETNRAFELGGVGFTVVINVKWWWFKQDGKNIVDCLICQSVSSLKANKVIKTVSLFNGLQFMSSFSHSMKRNDMKRIEAIYKTEQRTEKRTFENDQS